VRDYTRAVRARRVLHIVPHTHWDREWYEPFEGYRFLLVKTLDRLLDLLDSDPAFSHFNFDGQTAAIEDYLEVRPEAQERIRAAVQNGRIAMGPWRILMDEFLCSAETIVRNLQQGVASCARFGRHMRVGYIPDSFGHIAQMPQILQLAGLTDAVVWRGVPRAVDRTSFWWVAPDGSRVRTAYLATSYSNAATLPDRVEDLLVRARRIADDLEPFRPGDVLLAMNGSDHRPPQPHLPAAMAAANAAQDEFKLRVGSVEEYLRALPAPDDLPVWRGELRSGARANLLMGVAGVRVPLKQAEFTASALLERYAEPLQALAGSDTGRLLERAWRWMVENSAHDSICGCGIDAVADQVLARYQEATRVSDLVAADSLKQLGARLDTASLPQGREAAIVFNPSARPRSGGAVEVTLTAPGEPGALAFRAADGSLAPAQVLATQERIVVDMTLRGTQLARIVPTIHSRQISELWVNSVTVEPGSPAIVRMRLSPVPEGEFDVEAAKRAVEGLARRRPKAKFRVLGVGPPLCRALVRLPEVGGLGWTLLEPVSARDIPGPAARADGHVLDNGILRAEVGADGRVALTRLADGFRYEELLGIEESGDAGDEYNYSPPEQDLVVTEPSGPVVIDEVSAGPVEAALRFTRTYRVPAGLTGGGRARARRMIPMRVHTEIALRAGEAFLRARIDLENGATDHRVRVIVPLPFTTEHSWADGAFDVVERKLLAEGGDHEFGLPTFPCRRWVDVGDGTNGLAIFHRGTPEYEVPEGRTVAVTLLRGVGWLSRQGMAYRAGPAGPMLQTPGAQLIGDHRFELALYPHTGDRRAANVHDVSETYAYPARATIVRAHSGALPAQGSGLQIEPASVQLSALVRENGSLACRIYNASAEPARARITFGPVLQVRDASLVGLLGDVRAPVEVEGNTAAVDLRAWEIATLRLT